MLYTFKVPIPICLEKGAAEILVSPTEYGQCLAVIDLVDKVRDQSGKIWVCMPVDAPGPRVIPLRSHAMRNFVSEVFLDFIGNRPKDHSIGRAITEHEARVEYGGEPAPYDYTYHRVHYIDAGISSFVYPDAQTIFIDLGDRDHNAVKINAETAHLIDGASYNWLRPPDTEPLYAPERPKSVKKLLRRLRFLLRPASDADFQRILVWLSSTLNPHGPRPALVLDGPRAAALNTARFLRMILDPSAGWRNEFPSSEKQLRKLVENNYIVVFAGLQRLSAKRAETLCRLVHDYRRSSIVILHRSRPDRPALMDPELARSSLVVRLSEEPSAVEELKLRKHMHETVAEAFGLLIQSTYRSIINQKKARPPKVPCFPDTARWVAAATEVLGLTTEQIKAALTPSDKNSPVQPEQTKTTYPSTEITSNPPAAAPPTEPRPSGSRNRPSDSSLQPPPATPNKPQSHTPPPNPPSSVSSVSSV